MRKVLIPFVCTFIFIFISYAFSIQHSAFKIQNSLNDSVPKDTINNNIKSINYSIDSIHKLWIVHQAIIESAINLDIPKHISVNSQYNIQVLKTRISSLKTNMFVRASHILPLLESVKKYTDFYIIQKQEQTEILLGLAQSSNLMSVFENALKDYNLPVELKYLPVSESLLYNFTSSESGATGYWQLSYPIAKVHGLNINSFIDERKDIILSSRVAAVYLNELYKVYNDWLLVIAAYNSTPAIVNKAIRRAKGKMDFWSIYDFLPAINRDYVPNFIAIVYVMNFYNEHNLKPLKVNIPVEADTVKVYKQLHFKQVSAVLKLPFQQIKEMNPVYKENIIPESKQGYNLVLPPGDGEKFNKLKDSIYKYTDSTITSFMKLSYDYRDGKISGDKVQRELIYYIVKSKDNLGRIAAKYGVTVSDIKKWNHLKKSTVNKGQKLKIYYITYVSQPKIKSKSSTKTTDTTKTPAQTDSKISIKKINSNEEGEFVIYVVKLGDSYYKIAKENGIKIDDIFKLNDFDETHIIKPGDKIKLNKKQ